MNIIFLGAPGSGKGTQSAKICEILKIPTISTGNIIRRALKSGSEIGKLAKSYVDAGKLVPDEVVIGIVKERITQEDCKNGFILDGFPRTISQAEALDKMDIFIDKAIYIEVSDELIYKRMSGRRVCEKCEAVYNVNTDMKPKVDGFCDKCSGTLVQRMDDNLDTVKKRLEVYYKESHPLIDYYKNKDKLIVIDGHMSLNDMTNQIIKALGDS